MGTTTRVATRRWLLPLLCLALAAYFVREAPEVNGDGRLAFVYSVVDHHTLAVDPYVAELPIIKTDLASINGHYYMAKPPLPALLAIVPYAVMRTVFPAAQMDSILWKWVLTLVVSGGALAVTALLVERLARDARLGSPAVAGFATVVATPLLVYGTLLMAHAVAAALLAGTVLAAIQRRPLLAGVLAGALVSTDAVAAAGALVPLAFLGIEALRSRSVTTLARLGAGVAAGVFPLFAYQAAAFGSPLTSMYGYLVDPLQRAIYTSLHFGFPPPDVVLALLASPRNGLFVVAPIALVGTVLLIQAWRAHSGLRLIVAMTGGAAAAMILSLAALPRELVFWPDRAEYGPRLLIPVLPLLCWPLALLSMRMLGPLTLVGAIPQLVAVALLEPMLNPGATYQTDEVLRRLVTDAPTPSLLGLALPPAVPERMWMGRLAFFAASMAGLAVFAWSSLRPRSS